MVSTLASLLILGILIIVHEAGHFLVARWSGVRVLRFSIGFGPRLATWTRGHTEYAVSAIPFGGYVKMAGEQRAEHAQEPWEYLSKPIATRARIVFAGPFVNYLCAILTLWLVFVIGYPEALPVVGKLVPDMPAVEAGLASGDRVQAIDGKPVKTWQEMTDIIYASSGKPLAFSVTREGSPMTLTITPTSHTTKDVLGREKTIGQVGIYNAGDVEIFRVGPLEGLRRMIKLHNEFIITTLLGLWFLMTGQLSLTESATGPIGIVLMIKEGVQLGLPMLLYRVGLFNLCLAIFNLLPIPILDGGHLFFLGIERLRRRPVSLNVQERSAQVSFVLLMALILVICVNDLKRFGLIDRVMGVFGQ
ncbi:MAG: RIP metalloprotease RseP [Candidatus Omnitrophica bacterium CG11_big_fil_rev_8_21_14_0_20_63_9]|nr:MAG: RIP metalloprotease RseP [Candidatus Omnitrophica bacterium CG11_big_fil_rev_8_21_14_0_20_63_9]